MKIEEIIDFLEKDSKALTIVKEKFNYSTEEDITALKNNWYQIKNEKKKLQAKLKTYEKYDPEQLDQMIEEYDDMKSQIEELSKKGGDTKTIDIDQKKNLRKLEQLQKQIDTIQNESNDYKTRYLKSEKVSKINKIFDKHNVNPVFRDVLQVAFSNNGKIEEFDNKTELYYNSEKGDIPLDAYANEFFQSETGQNYLLKPENSGGNAYGNSKSKGQATIKRQAYNAMSPEEQAQAATNMRKGQLKIVD